MFFFIGKYCFCAECVCRLFVAIPFCLTSTYVFACLWRLAELRESTQHSITNNILCQLHLRSSHNKPGSKYTTKHTPLYSHLVPTETIYSWTGRGPLFFWNTYFCLHYSMYTCGKEENPLVRWSRCWWIFARINRWCL